MRSFAVLLAVMLVVGTGCKRSHDEAKKVQRVESQLNVPGTPPEKKKLQDRRLDWCMEQFVDAYDKVGIRDKKWDSAVHDALTIFAQSRAYGRDIKGYPHVLASYIKRAVELGCNDPLVGYLHVRFVKDRRDMSDKEIAEAFARAAGELRNSHYPPFVTFYSCLGAAETYNAIRPYPQEGQAYLDAATALIQEVVRDKNTPLEEVDESVSDFLAAIENWKDKKDRFDPIDQALLANWPSSGVAYVLKAKFYVDYAWDGRTRKAANKVTKEQWQLFAERLAETEKIISKGMEIDPKEGRLPAIMIQVVSGQGKGLADMRSWWEKSMAADPNNYDACKKLLHFLQPRWYGSRKAMIEFGQECAKSDKFGGTVPLILADAHTIYNNTDGATDGSYWLKPDVWPDLKMAFERFFELNPNATSWHHNYARYAYWCEQWDTLQQQLALMGDDVNYNYFGGRESFDKMVAEVKAHTATAKQ